MLSLLDQARAGLEREFTLDANTTGVNDGVASGQTVPDIHLNMTLDELRLMPCGEDRSSLAQPRRSVATAWSKPANKGHIGNDRQNKKPLKSLT